MTTEEIKAARARADAATPGPWRCETLRGIVLAPARVLGAMGVVIGEQAYNPVATISPGQARPADLTFVVHARQDVPALADECLRLRAVLIAWCERFGHPCPEYTTDYPCDPGTCGDCDLVRRTEEALLGEETT